MSGRARRNHTPAFKAKVSFGPLIAVCCQATILFLSPVTRR
jgi:hypothetical protein